MEIVKVIRRGQWTKAIVVEEPEEPKSYTVLRDVRAFDSKREAVRFAAAHVRSSRFKDKT
jgi:hypothetical protein